ncbi:MAG: PKD domain-containing protein, partial [Candidatus Staskawiczbacteria bacterium]|nr:PKD domain-containing protein [Candidatus Staskawiczbacteria bacterium]
MNTQQKSFLFVLTALAVVFLASVTSPSVASASTIGNWTHMDGEGGIARFVYSKTGIEGIEMHYDVATADKVCQLAGFSGAESFGCASEYQGRCGFVSCYDNTLTKWDGNKFVTGNACSMGNKWLATLKCKNNPISLSVSVSPNPATTGEKVTFNSSVSGGTGSYTYSWTGACTSLSAFCGKSFSNPGTYTSTLTVTSGNQIKSASKSVTVNQACTSHSIKKCSGNVVYWYDSCGTKQEVYQACTANQTCSNGSCVNLQINCYNNSDCNDNNPNTSDVCKNAGTPQSYCQNPSLPIACTSNTDCGISAYTGSPYCFNNNVFQAYQTYACANAGTPQSYCQNSSAPQLQQSCLSNQTCSNGSCVTNPTPPPPPPPPPSNDLVVSCYSTPNPLNVGQQISFI